MNKLKNTYIKYDKSITQNDFDLLLSGVKKMSRYGARNFVTDTLTNFKNNNYFIILNQGGINNSINTGVDNNRQCCETQLTIKEALAILYPKEWYKDLKKGDYVVIQARKNPKNNKKRKLNHVFKILSDYDGSINFTRGSYVNSNLTDFRLATKEEAAMFEDNNGPCDVTTYKMKSVEFVIGKWYIDDKTWKGEKWYIKIDNITTGRIAGNSISTSGTYKDNDYWTNSEMLENIRILSDLEEIQQYLPKGHVDLISKDLSPEDAIEGQDYWYDTKDDGAFIGRFKYTDDECYYGQFISTKTKSFSDDDVFINDMCGFRKATTDESKWLQACIDKGKYISQEDALKSLESFKLPEKWCIQFDNNWDIISKFKPFNRGFSGNASITSYYRYDSLDEKRDCSKEKGDYTEITLEQFKKYVLKSNNNEMKSNNESWCVKITKENVEVVKKWMNYSSYYSYSIGAYYGDTSTNKKYGTNETSSFNNNVLTTEEFYAKIGHTIKYEVGDWVYVIKADISKNIVSTIQQITKIASGNIFVTNSSSTFSEGQPDLYKYLRKATQAEIDAVSPKSVDKWSKGTYIVTVKGNYGVSSSKLTPGEVHQISRGTSDNANRHDNRTVSWDATSYWVYTNNLEWFATKVEAEVFAKTLIKPKYEAAPMKSDSIKVRVIKDIDPEYDLQCKGKCPFIPKGTITWITPGDEDAIGTSNVLTIENNRLGANFYGNYFEFVDKQYEPEVKKSTKYEDDYPINNWYTQSITPKLLVYITKIDKVGQYYGYGLDSDGEWTNDSESWSNNDGVKLLKRASKSEIEAILFRYTNEQYPADTKFISSISDGGIERIIKPYNYSKGITWWLDNDTIRSKDGLDNSAGGCSNPQLMKDGVWVKIVSKPNLGSGVWGDLKAAMKPQGGFVYGSHEPCYITGFDPYSPEDSLKSDNKLTTFDVPKRAKLRC